MSGPLVFALRAILAGTLYLFLAWALLVLWRDLKQQASLLASRKVPPLSITLQQNTPHPQVRFFQQPEVIIGRDPACDWPLEADSVSARHSRFSYHHEHWWLEDLDSTNGTFLNREKVVTPTVVISGDEVRCGETSLVVAIAGETVFPSPKESPQNEEK